MFVACVSKWGVDPTQPLVLIMLNLYSYILGLANIYVLNDVIEPTDFLKLIAYKLPNAW
jgi:hypothetical protein